MTQKWKWKGKANYFGQKCAGNGELASMDANLKEKQRKEGLMGLGAFC